MLPFLPSLIFRCKIIVVINRSASVLEQRHEHIKFLESDGELYLLQHIPNRSRITVLLQFVVEHEFGDFCIAEPPYERNLDIFATNAAESRLVSLHVDTVQV